MFCIGGSAVQLFKSIRETLFGLPETTRIYVGHDYMPNNRPLMYETTVGEEKASNKHVNVAVSESEFIQMRQDRDRTLGLPKLLYPSLQASFIQL